jgi:hypothetical protein
MVVGPRSSPTGFGVTTPANVLLRAERLAGYLELKLEAVAIELATPS